MKKLIASIIALVAISASAYTVTNTVTIVSNVYNKIATTYYVTNNVKNTHVNYYYTNNVYTVTNKTILVSQENHTTNISHTVTYDASQEAVSEAQGYANSASQSETRARGYAADAYDHEREGQRTLSSIIQKQAWFDEHFGQMVTVTYYAEDTVARSRATGAWNKSNDAMDVANAAANTANAAANTANAAANAAQASANAANQGVANSIEYTTAVSNKLEQGVANSIEYTTAVSNKLEQGVADLDGKFDMIQDRMLIYNNEHEIWNYEVYDGDTLVMTIRIPMWDRWNEGSFYYYAATYWRKVSGYSLTSVYKGESTGMMYFGLKHSASTKNVRMIGTEESLDKGVKGDSEIWYDNGSRIFVRYVSDHKEITGFVKSDLNIYDANSNVVDRIATTNEIGDISREKIYKTEDIEYLPGGDWNYDIIDVGGNVVNTFTIMVDNGVIRSASDPTGYYRYQNFGTHGFYVSMRFNGDLYEVGLIGTSTSDLSVKVWMPFYQRSSDWHMPPRGETAAAHTSEYIGWKVRYNSSPMVDRSYYTKFDPAKYDANTNKIGRTAFMDDLNALSNWVERTFMKR